MKKRLYVQQDAGILSAAVMENGSLLSFSEEKNGIQAEQIYLARVDRIMKGMEAFFVKLTAKENGFLPFSECKTRPRSGELLPVQVKKPPVGEKLPYCSCDISLAGRYVILLPETARIAVSNRIENEETKQRLQSWAKEICPPQMGLILRSEAIDAEKELLQADLHALINKWQIIKEKIASSSAPRLLEEKEPLLSSLLRDEHGEWESIITNLSQFPCAAPCPVQYAEHPFALENVERKLQKSLSRKVYLPCGGYLIIDRTEAMTVIDVNSGKYAGKKSGTESTFLSLNLEAAREIARLLRLRNMGGIILIDFVDMTADESRNAVVQALSDALMDDPVKCVLHGFTSLGLLEMTRKKSGLPLTPIAPCPHCGGTGLKEESK